MNLWRLEILRLARTRRWLALFGVYLFFGFTSPLLATYMQEILGRFGGDVQVIVPEPVPADAVTQFISNAQQIGLLVVVVVAAGALAFDARPEIGAFLRTRVSGIWPILRPRFVVTALAACAAFIAGLAATWYGTAILLGALPAGSVLWGVLLGCLYLVFVVAIVALATALTKSVLAAVLVTLGALLVLPLIGLFGTVRPWLPSELAGALDALVRGAVPTDYARAAVVTGVLTVAALAAAVQLASRREL